MREDADGAARLYRHAVAGSLAIASSELLLFPLDTLKVHSQLHALPKNPVTLSQAYNYATSNSNFFGLYRGIGINVFGKLLSTTSRFSVFEVAKSFYQDGRPHPGLSIPESFSAGFMAGCVESLVNTPFELLTIRLQAQTPLYTSTLSSSSTTTSLSLFTQTSLPQTSEERMFSQRLLRDHGIYGWKTSSGTRSYPWLNVKNAAAVNFMDAIRGGLREEGWDHLRRGFRSTLFRDSLYAALFFSSWTAMDELAFEIWAAQTGYYYSPVDLKMEVSLLDACVEASLAAAIATVVTHPLDTTKTRTQATVLPKYQAMERSLLNIKEDMLWWQKLGGFRSWETGIHFHALALRAVRNSFATFCLVGTYFLALNHLIERGDRP